MSTRHRSDREHLPLLDMPSRSRWHPYSRISEAGAAVAQNPPKPLIRTTTQTNTPRVDEDNIITGVGGLTVERTRSWGLISAEIIKRAEGEVNWRSDHHRINLFLTAIRGTSSIGGGPAQPMEFLPGEVSFTPGSVPTRTIMSAGRMTHLLQRPETYDAIISDIVRGGSVHFENRYPIGDPLASQIVSTIAHEMESGFLDRILVDSLNTALAVRIVRQFVDPSKITLAPSNGLSRERLQRVCDYIEAHLDDPLTLADLAGVACLSPYHFSRSFKQAVGVGTQRYVMQRRIERAKTLMRQTNQPLALIAQEAGFTDQSHLTSLFRRETGITPGRYRAALA
jgi:AraC family transcriptional regulator